VREKPLQALENFFPGQQNMPAIVRFLKWTFLSERPGLQHRLLKKAAQKFFHVA
jgi:hypothetical protein